MTLYLLTTVLLGVLSYGFIFLLVVSHYCRKYNTNTREYNGYYELKGILFLLQGAGFLILTLSQMTILGWSLEIIIFFAVSLAIGGLGLYFFRVASQLKLELCAAEKDQGAIELSRDEISVEIELDEVKKEMEE
ncbi:MAG: hypothetical protein HQ536_03365 [Parcubacteria group bacterium]|nr:hypothetical protein [Parcubacteria group bacterium]